VQLKTHKIQHKKETGFNQPGFLTKETGFNQEGGQAMVQAGQRACGVSTLGDFQNPWSWTTCFSPPAQAERLD